MSALSIKVVSVPKVLVEVAGRVKNSIPITRTWPEIIRRGPGSLNQQIVSRTHFNLQGGRKPWAAPAHEQGGGVFRQSELLEDVMWQAVRGGSGSITRFSSNSAEVGVNDQIIRIRSAELGNKIVSNAPYFSFVTGSFQERTTEGKAVPSKPAKTTANVFPFNTAMYWFLRLQFGFWATPEELQAGLSVPPKNMGYNPVMLKRMTSVISNYLLRGKAVEMA